MSGLPEWQADMVRVVGDQLVRAIVADQRRTAPARPSSMAAPQAGPVGGQAGRNGWVEAPPIGPRLASEVAIVDRLVEKFAGSPNRIK